MRIRIPHTAKSGLKAVTVEKHQKGKRIPQTAPVFNNNTIQSATQGTVLGPVLREKTRNVERVEMFI